MEEHGGSTRKEKRRKIRKHWRKETKAEDEEKKMRIGKIVTVGREADVLVDKKKWKRERTAWNKDPKLSKETTKGQTRGIGGELGR